LNADKSLRRDLPCAAAKCAAVCRPPPKSRSTLGNPRHLEGNEMKSMQKKFYYAREGKKCDFLYEKYLERTAAGMAGG